jgi:hypothetical protein
MAAISRLNLSLTKRLDFFLLFTQLQTLGLAAWHSLNAPRIELNGRSDRKRV